jgi:hypothetical protein
MVIGRKRVIVSIVISIFMTILHCNAYEEIDKLDKDKNEALLGDNEIASTVNNQKNFDVYDGALSKSYRNAFLREFIKIMDDSCRYLGKFGLDNNEGIQQHLNVKFSFRHN